MQGARKRNHLWMAGLGKGMDTGQVFGNRGSFSIVHTVLDRTVPPTSFEILMLNL